MSEEAMVDYREGERVRVWMDEHPLVGAGWYEAEVGTVDEEARLSFAVFVRDEEPPHEEYWIGTLFLRAFDVLTRVAPLESDFDRQLLDLSIYEVETRIIPPAGDPFAAAAVDPRQLTIFDVEGVGSDPAEVLRGAVRLMLYDTGGVPTEADVEREMRDPETVAFVREFYLHGGEPDFRVPPGAVIVRPPEPGETPEVLVIGFIGELYDVAEAADQEKG